MADLVLRHRGLLILHARPGWRACVSIMFFIVFIVSICCGISASSCGISESSRSRSGSKSWTSSVVVSTPSMVSNTDRIDQQTGML